MKNIINTEIVSKSGDIEEGERPQVEKIVRVLRDEFSTNQDGYDDMDYWFAYIVESRAVGVSNELLKSELVSGYIARCICPNHKIDEDKNYYIEEYRVHCTYKHPEEYYYDYD